MADLIVSDTTQIVGVVVGAVVALAMPLVVGYVARAQVKLAAKLADAVAKVETVAVTAGVAANRALALQNEVRTGTENRTQMLAGVVEAVEANKVETAEIKKIALDIHTLSDGTMGVALETGLEAAQGRYDAKPTPENKAKLDVARKKFEEHAAKERLVAAKNAGAK